ncbi:MAG TPA: 30S ribosomal protein S8 [Methanocorpusculum sp.]|nr:30S ribosomal protein S8 [Methanocorpusculum sp.]HJJ90265.1 30S ribosomal protein S8 [Methanocorpusculum sp.]
MTKQNPIADAMSAIKNAGDTGKLSVIVEPASRLFGDMLKVMQEYGYISGFEIIEDGRGDQYEISLTGGINKCGVITPRFSVKVADLESWETRYLPGKGFGIIILTTSRGVMSHEKARKLGIGGELLGYVF